jgi:hypothetical protein
MSKAMFVLGGPGSGKDYVINNILKRYDLVEVQMDQILNGAVVSLIESSRNLLINGNADLDKITLVKSILDGYEFCHTIVSVTNKVSRERNSSRDRPLNEQTRIRKWLDAENIVLDNTFVFKNSLNLAEASQADLSNFQKQIETYLGYLQENHIRTVDEVLEWGTDETVATYKAGTPGEGAVNVKPKLTLTALRKRGVKNMPPNAYNSRVGGVDYSQTGSFGTTSSYAGGLVSHYEPEGKMIPEGITRVGKAFPVKDNGKLIGHVQRDASPGTWRAYHKTSKTYTNHHTSRTKAENSVKKMEKGS